MKVRIALLLVFISVLTVQCNPEDDNDDTVLENTDSIVYNPESYDLQIPDRFPALIQSIELTKSGVKLGRHLFYDPILSGDSTQSCSSCHNQSFGFTDNGQKLSVGIDGTVGTKNSMALINLGWRTDLFWDGRSPNLIDQALQPVKDPIEMHDTWPNAINKLKNHPTYPDLFFEAFGIQDFDSTHVAEAIAQFELTLISGNSKYDKFRRSEVLLTAEEELGMNIFNQEPRQKSDDPPGADCFHCHAVQSNAPITSLEFFNNGLDMEMDLEEGLSAVTGLSSDKGKFKVPTLRNVEVTSPYMHDGRFETLEEVIEHYASGINQSSTLDPIMTKTDGLGDGLLLTDAEKRALVAFLKTLTDEEFLMNPEHASPFED